MTNLKELLERVRGATGPDRELDDDLLEAARIGYYDYTRSHYEYQTDDASRLDLSKEWPHYRPTASVDAALAFAERVLPGRAVVMGLSSNPSPYCGIAPSTLVNSATLPLAIISATLTALIAQEDAQ